MFNRLSEKDKRLYAGVEALKLSYGGISYIAQLFPIKYTPIRGSMKLFSFTLILIGLLGLLAYTNPKLDNYDQFISQRITEETRKEKDPVAGALGSLLGGFAANLMTTQTVRKDYVFFSTYDAGFGNEHLRAIGVLNNFYITESPEYKHGE